MMCGINTFTYHDVATTVPIATTVSKVPSLSCLFVCDGNIQSSFLGNFEVVIYDHSAVCMIFRTYLSSNCKFIPFDQYLPSASTPVPAKLSPFYCVSANTIWYHLYVESKKMFILHHGRKNILILFLKCLNGMAFAYLFLICHQYCTYFIHLYLCFPRPCTNSVGQTQGKDERNIQQENIYPQGAIVLILHVLFEKGFISNTN